MPIGSDLNLTLPEVGDAASVAAARIVDTLEKLAAACEGDVPGAAVDISANLDLQANGVTSTAFVGLDNLADSNDGLPGYLFRYQNNLWFVHPDGAFQVTDGVGLNASGIGGIGGDYGAGDESVDYDATNDWYNFTDHPGDWSDLRVNGIRLKDPSAGSIRLIADTASVSSDQDWAFKALAATTSGIVTQTSAGVTGVTSSVADAFTFGGNLTVNGTFSRSGGPDLVMTVQPTCGVSAALAGASDTWFQGAQGVQSNATGFTALFHQGFQLHIGDTVKSLVYTTQNGGGTANWTVTAYYQSDTGTRTSLGSQNLVGIANAVVQNVFNFTDHTLATGEAFFVEFQHTSGAGNPILSAIRLTYRPA